MAAIPQELMESELFGHEKGAFTGANNRREGRFEQARGGTLFLDEIGDMPAATQTRLLRVLQDGEFFRVGGVDSIKADVRIIAATHQKLESLVETGAFREDLFHRLNVIRIHVPRLSERREDIPRLLMHFLAAASSELGVETKALSEEALNVLTQLPWPGNVRQLENTCRWLTVMAAGREVLRSDLPPELLQHSATSPRTDAETWHEQLASWANRQLSEGQSNVLRQALPLFETIMIEAALQHTGGRKAEAAELLGWGRNTLTRKIKDLDLPAD
jgi:two-component system nitrogen regulation response regulator GlnG